MLLWQLTAAATAATNNEDSNDDNQAKYTNRKTNSQSEPAQEEGRERAYRNIVGAVSLMATCSYYRGGPRRWCIDFVLVHCGMLEIKHIVWRSVLISCHSDR